MAVEGPAETVGALVRRYRTALGWTQRDLAVRAGVSVRTVRNVESTRSAASATKLLAALGVPGDDAATNKGQEPGLRIEILGTLAVYRDGVPLDLPSGRIRSLLGLLAVQPGVTVGRAEIVDALWGEDPPRTCEALVNTYVARLRRVLEPGRTLRRVAGGYRLDGDLLSLDLTRFDDLLRRGLAEAAAAAAAADAAADADTDGDPHRVSRLLGAALDCWRGPVLAGTGLAHHPAAVAAAHRRRTAASAFADVEMALGRPERVVERLHPVVVDEPLDEGMHARLMLGLAGAGRQAEALRAFAELRDRLRAELGIEPGVELRDAHVRVLRQDVAAQPQPGGPAQLPAPVPAFVGRAMLLRRLDGLAGNRDGNGNGNGAAAGPMVCAISGAAGIGKTTLALQWAHRAADRFPDGQLYVNLRGFDPAASPVDPADVIRDFLAALDVPADRLPRGGRAQAGLYRSRLAGRRMLLLLDNARDADQVRPLLPGSAGIVVVVTSRDRLTGLVADGAHPITVELLSTAEATSLLTHRLGARRLAGEPAAARRIVERCAGLPLALVVVAARLAGNDRLPLAGLAAELDDSRRALDALDGGDSGSDVRAVLASSYRHLDEQQASLFRLLGLHPGPEVTVPAAAALAGTTPERAGAALSALARNSLVSEHLPGRYTLHDVLRRYAGELAHTVDGPNDRRSAIGRLIRYHVRGARRARALLDPQDSADARRAPDGPRTADEALRWYDAERPVLLGCVRLAGEVGLDAEAAELAIALTELFDRRGHWHEWAAVTGQALDRPADPAAVARLHRSRARALVWLGDPAAAVEHLRQALDGFRSLGDTVGLGHTYRTLSWCLGRQGARRPAVRYARAAVALHRAAGDRAGLGLGLNTLGWQHAHLGEHAIALRYCREAVALLNDAGDRNGEGYALDTLGFVCLRIGDHAGAAAHYRRAVTLFQQTGDLYQEADTLVRLGDVEAWAGGLAAAERAWRRAGDILRALGHPDATRVRARLRDQRTSLNAG